MPSNVEHSLIERLQDAEFRREYGAARAKSALAFLLLDARTSQGLTQEELANRLHVSQAYIAKLESGEANPTIGHVGSMLARIWMQPTFGAKPLYQSSIQTESSRVPVQALMKNQC